jgi:hypothetical protein
MPFGRSSERITRRIEQLELQLEELETGEARAETEAATAEPPALQPDRKKPARKALPDHLPRQEVVHEPENDGSCTCPSCGGAMATLGEDVTEVLDYVPGRFQVIRHVVGNRKSGRTLTLGAILRLAEGARHGKRLSGEAEALVAQMKMVAGAGFEPAAFRL